MKAKRVIWVLFSLFLLILFGCSNNEVNDGTANQTKDEVAVEEYVLDQEILNSAEEENNLELCSSIHNKGIKDLCFNNIAFATLSLEACDGISSSISLESCKSRIGVLKEDTSVCSTLSTTWADFCFRDIALNKNDSEVCSNINFDDTKDTCYSKIAERKNDFGLCSKIDDERSRGTCKYTIAVRLKNPELCGMFKEGNVGLLKDLCLKNIAQSTNNANLCQDIAMKSLKEECFTNIAKNSQRLEV